MRQLFVTTASTGPGNSGDINFSLCKAWEYVRHCRDILMCYGQSPAQIPAGKCEINSAGLGIESKAPFPPPPHHSTALEWCWGQSFALKPRYVPSPMGSVVTNNWCIIFATLNGNHRPWMGNHYSATCRGSNPSCSDGKQRFYPCAILALRIDPETLIPAAG